MGDSVMDFKNEAEKLYPDPMDGSKRIQYIREQMNELNKHRDQEMQKNHEERKEFESKKRKYLGNRFRVYYRPAYGRFDSSIRIYPDGCFIGFMSFSNKESEFLNEALEGVNDPHLIDSIVLDYLHKSD